MNKNISVIFLASLLGFAQIILLLLKAFRVISWTWTVVLIPLWIEIALIFLTIAVLLIFYRIDLERRKRKWEREQRTKF